MPALYDTFLIQEPLRQDPFAVTHNPHDTATLIDIYRKSIIYFEERRRRRAIERLQYELGLLHVQLGQWKKALKVLEPLWRSVSWRREGWWGMLGGLGERVRECAWRCGDAETVIKGSWEGMGSCFDSSLEEDYDFSNCLDGMENLAERPNVVVRADEIVPCLSFTFSFGATEGHVGEPLWPEMVITSSAKNSTAPICLDQISVSFEGGLEDFKVGHMLGVEPDQMTSDDVPWYHVPLMTLSTARTDKTTGLSTRQDRLGGTTDLRFTPGSTQIFSFHLIPKDTGVVRVASITLATNAGDFDFRYIVAEADHLREDGYWLPTIEGLSRRPERNHALNEIRIHARPPKMQIKIPDLRKDYFTGETVTLEIEVTNGEHQDADLNLEARFLGQVDAVPTLAWTANPQAPELFEAPLSDQKRDSVQNYTFGHIEKSVSRKINLTFAAQPLAMEAVLEIKALYQLLTEPGTPISKILVNEVVFDRPFEANYDFQSSVDAWPMPNYFDITEANDPDNVAMGLRQVWTSTVRLASFASELLVIKDVTPEIIGVHDGAICRVSRLSPDPLAVTTIAPNDSHESRFEISAQKLDLDDRQSTTFQFQLSVRWRRNHPNAVFATTILSAPDLTIPFGEPRVLAAIQPPSEDASADFIPLSYIIENPSTHVLNFDISMETSDEFAFSGPKTTSLQLVPVSRHTVRYNIVPLVRGKWITPDLRVLDTHFQQVLKISGTGGMRSDRRGPSIWVDAEE